MGEMEALRDRMQKELAKCETRLAVVKGKKGVERIRKEIEGLEQELQACRFAVDELVSTAPKSADEAEERIVKRFESFRKKLDRTTLKFP